MGIVENLYSKIDDDKFIIFGMSHCPYTINSVKYLKNKGINYKYYKIDKYYNDFFNLLNKLSNKYNELDIDINHKTIPIIFNKKKFIGGYSELIKMF